MRHARCKSGNGQNQHIANQFRFREAGEVTGSDVRTRDEREIAIDAVVEDAGPSRVDDILVRSLECGKGAVLTFREHPEPASHTVNYSLYHGVARLRGQSPLSEPNVMGDARCLRTTETIPLDTDDKIHSVFECRGNPSIEGSEAYSIHIGIDAAVAIEQQVSQEIGPEHWVSEDQEIMNQLWFLRKVSHDIAFATPIREHLIAVVWVLLDP